jgi:hypothetical protein
MPIILLFSIFYQPVLAQRIDGIQWLTFEQLDDSLNSKPKKVFLDFVTD